MPRFYKQCVSPDTSCTSTSVGVIHNVKGPAMTPRCITDDRGCVAMHMYKSTQEHWQHKHTYPQWCAANLYHNQEPPYLTGSTATVAQSQEPLNHKQEPPPKGHDPLRQGQEPLNLMREAMADGEVCQSAEGGQASSKYALALLTSCQCCEAFSCACL